MRLSRLSLTNYKSFESFTVGFGSNAFLVGPNNAGKSTLIEGVRAAAGMFRIAATRRPSKFTTDQTRTVWVYPLKSDILGLEVENLRHQFRGLEARLRLSTDSAYNLTAVWPEEDAAEDPFFYVVKGTENPGSRKPPTLRDAIPRIGVIPTLSPISRSEELLERSYVETWSGSRRTSQHLRNLISHIRTDNEFDAFLSWVVRHLPEIENLELQSRPSNSPGRRELDLFYREIGQHTDREVCWAGDGLQIYLQILTHLWRHRTADVVVLDEPDVFLHADLQRRLVRLLESLPCQTITATHSPEMLAEASHESVIWVDKSKRRAIRRPDAASMEDLSSQIGSQFNLRLASALRSRVALFVEGDDMAIFKRVARRIGLTRLGSELGCSVIPLGGYTQWEHVEPFQWLVTDFLSSSVRVFVILDRDYRLDEEIREVERRLDNIGVVPHVWRRKELESYLLEPYVLSRLTGQSVRQVETDLNELSGALLPDVVSNSSAPI